MKRQPAVMMGLAIGDALGMPFEFHNHQKIADAKWDGGFKPGQPDTKPLLAGQYTDDCKMAICIAQSLVDCHDYNAQDVADRYVKWYLSGDLRGIGIQTQWALQNMLDGTPLPECGVIMRKERPSFRKKGRDTNVCGNGTAMRIAPLGVYFKDDPVKIFKHSIQDAVLTHDHQDAKDASLAVAYITGLLSNNEHPITAVDETIALLSNGNVKEKLVKARNMAEASKSWDDALVLGAEGTAHATLGSAVFCFLRFCGDGFKHVVVNSVKMGGDTDTRAAISGALAGTYFGIDGIPEEYLNVEHEEFLNALDQVLSLGPKMKV